MAILAGAVRRGLTHDNEGPRNHLDDGLRREPLSGSLQRRDLRAAPAALLLKSSLGARGIPLAGAFAGASCAASRLDCSVVSPGRSCSLSPSYSSCRGILVGLGLGAGMAGAGVRDGGRSSPRGPLPVPTWPRRLARIALHALVSPGRRQPAHGPSYGVPVRLHDPRLSIRGWSSGSP